MARIFRTIAACIAVTICFFYTGCGSIQVANALGKASSAPLTIATTLLPSAVDGTPYVAVLDSTGGTPGYTWDITAGKLPSGVSLAPITGVISGTPTISGNFSIGVTLTDAGIPAQKKTSTVTLTVAPPALAIVAATLPSATNGTAYSQTLKVTGGTPSYAWSITSGSLPAGLRLGGSNGVISGKPTSTGTANFDVTVTDMERPTQTQSTALSISVAPPALKITTLALPSPTSGASYSQTLRASGGTPAYKWTIVGGDLPEGLTLAQATGAITGIPDSSGTALIIVSVTDSGTPIQATKAAITIVVAPSPLKISAPALPSVTVGMPYSQNLQVTGGTAPYTWSITSGQLPAGLALASSTGVISGTPITSGKMTFVATVSDNSQPSKVTSKTAAIVVKPSPLAMNPIVLPAVKVGTGYSQTLQASGGTTPYRWSIGSGNLPAGLSLTPSTGTISGTPTTSGMSTFTATVTDSCSPAQSIASISSILVAPTPLIITSSALPPVNAGTGYSQTLQAVGGKMPYTWSITSGKLPSGLTLTPSTGTISGAPTSSGSYTFTTTATDNSKPGQEASTTTAMLVVSTTLTIATQTLPPDTSGQGYSQALQATGGAAPYIWSITSGQLPAGLSLSTSGVISGTASSSMGSSFSVTVLDSGSPNQSNSVGMRIAGASTPLTIASSALSSGVNGTPYAQSLQASGGTPAYTWSITSGTLPAGLTLASTTGAISGLPSSSGTSNFTATVTDNGSPAQKQSAASSITVGPAQTSTGPATWFIRTDGGTRYSAQVPTGQCNGKADAAYPGSGINQACAFQEMQLLWDTGSGVSGSGGWVIAGGDTVVIRGCTAIAGQVNPSNPNCRIGWSAPTGNANLWCYGVGSYTCYNPPIPAGTAVAHTRILGACAYDGSCNAGNVTTRANLTQLYAGFSLTWAINLGSTQYVDIQGIELTTHNGACSLHGIPQYPTGCSTNQPLSDYSSNGFLTNKTTSHILFQDVYVDGFESSGFNGPIGGPITMTRVNASFNAADAWNFDDGSDTPDAAGSSITASYVTMNGNGCKQQYPISNPLFPAMACWDNASNSTGGDTFSGQDTELDSFTCDHCVGEYNTKDNFIGPHTQIASLSITNSTSFGNMGAQWKWGSTVGATHTFQNNLTVGNCYRMQEAIPGAAQNFASSTGLPGSYLSLYCRAGGTIIAVLYRSGSTYNFVGDTIIAASDLVADINCGYYGAGNAFHQETNCNTSALIWKNDNLIGYVDPNLGVAPGLFYPEPAAGSIGVTSSYNSEYGFSGFTDTCGVNGIICANPQLVNLPAQPWPGSETALDVFSAFTAGNSFYATSVSPLIGAGTSIGGLTTDYYGTTRTTPPTIGGVN